MHKSNDLRIECMMNVAGIYLSKVQHIVVSPAYGRDYKSKKDVIQAWNEGKDFINESQLHTGGGTYISKDDLQPGEKVELRYNRMTRLTFSEGA